MDKAEFKSSTLQKNLRQAEIEWNRARYSYWQTKGRFIEKDSAYKMVLQRRSTADDKKCAKIEVDAKTKKESETYEKGLKKRPKTQEIEPTMDVQLEKSLNRIYSLNEKWDTAN